MAKETIGPHIKRIRKANNLTQEQFAKSLGYSHKSVITHIEKGDADMTYEKILLLLKKYNLDANELFKTKKDDKKAKGIIVYIHGLHGSADEAADFSFLKNHYDVVGLDYTDGNPWELEHTIVDKFKYLTSDYDEIIVIANSIGAFYCYEYLSDFNIKKAFFISPIADMFKIVFDMMIENNISVDKLREERFIDLKNGQTLYYEFYKHVLDYEDSWKTPTEILYGSDDEMVYIENISNFLAKHPLTRLTIKDGSGHFFHTKEEKEFIKNWVLRNLK